MAFRASRTAVFVSLVGIILSCQPLEHPYTEPQAVGDAKQVLGLVPITRYDVQAYRLLVCQRLNHYTKEILADESRCRVALHDRDGNEVAFFSSDFQRSLAFKYRGYTKQIGIAALAVVPLALVGVLVGSWRMLRLAGKEVRNSRALRLQDFDRGKYSKSLIDNGVGRVGVRYYMHAWSEAATKIFADIKKSADAGEVQAKIAELEQFTNSYQVATEVSATAAAKKTLEQIRYSPHEQGKQMVAAIERGIVARNGSLSFSEQGTFGNDFFQLRKQIQSLLQSAKETPSLEKLHPLADRVELLVQDYVIKLPAFEKLYADASVLTIERSFVDFDRHFKRFQDMLEEKKDILLADSSMRARVELAHMQERALIKSITAGGVSSAGALGALHVLDKSIWGYEERQLDRYWQHVFIAADDFSDPQMVEDLPLLLRALANAFGYEVNAAALEL